MLAILLLYESALLCRALGDKALAFLFREDLILLLIVAGFSEV